MRKITITTDIKKTRVLLGCPVLIKHKVYFRFGKGRNFLQKDFFSMSCDVSGFENGHYTWVLLHIFRKPFSFYLINRFYK